MVFWRGLVYFLLWGRYKQAPVMFKGMPKHTKAYLFGLALILRHWGKEHFGTRETIGSRMARQVGRAAVPCTSVSLAWVSGSRLIVLVFVLVVYPIIALFAAIRATWSGLAPSVASAFHKALLEPRDRLALWSLNSILVAFHALRTGAPGYLQEDLYAFLETAERVGISAAPCLKASSLVVKGRGEKASERNSFFFENAAKGGNWIIQERLENDAFMSTLVPANAPLSTFSVVTASRGGGLRGADGPSGIFALSCVLRAGRAGAQTDDDSMALLFNVDLGTGIIGKGVCGSRWKRLNLTSLLLFREPSEPAIVEHRDSGALIAGRTVPDIKKIEEMCVDAHRKVAPDVPLAAWDVALTSKGRLLLQVNFSCDFVVAQLDYEKYFTFVDEYFSMLDGERVAEVFKELRMEPM